MAFTTLKKGSKGDLVKALQYILGAKPDGKFGTETELLLKAYQEAHKITADGKAGKQTMQAIVNKAPTLRIGSKGEYVFSIETILQTMNQDGEYKEDEEAHIKTFQASKNLDIDGIVGKKTWTALFGLDEGSNAVIDNGANTKQPVYYLQGDSKWRNKVFTKNNTYNKNQTIGNSGCGITCAAMVIATWWNKNITPVDTAKECVEKGYRTSNSGTNAGFFSVIAKEYGASKYITTSSYETAKNIIDQGGLVIVNVGPSCWTKGGHYILWWKRDGDTVYINDPASKASNRVKNTASTLKNASKGYYCFLK